MNYSFTDTDLRDKAVVAPLILLRPVDKGLVGLMAETGFIGGYRYAFNVDKNDHEKLFNDQFYLEIQALHIRRISDKLKVSSFIGVRVEDYKKSYSVYVNEENDNLKPFFQTDIEGQWKQRLPFKFNLSAQRSYYRERRALTKEGIFVPPGEKLVPDILDVFSTSFLQKFETETSDYVGLGPLLIVTEDRVYGGRSFYGIGINGVAGSTILGVKADFNISYLNRHFRHQLSTFQSISDSEKLKDENVTLGVTLAKESIRNLKLDLMMAREVQLSNQIDSVGRNMSNYRTQMITLMVTKII
ncbi:MAG: hypothetical protein K2P81_11655 [Bacteriovoracaceae bacterium]|nr:hypothetical protein [Bacteriovoracaceae bacterium]